MGMLTRYQTSPSEPVALRTANISCGRKSGRNAFMTLITEAGALGVEVLRTEAAPVVRHRDLDEGAPAAQHDRDPPGLAVLAHVRQCLLDDAEEHDLLRIAQTGQVALGPEIDLDAGRVRER